MSSSAAGPLHAYLVGTGRDAQGRLATDVLGFSDERLEQVHDYIQWLFPLPTRSAAQPQSPVLTQAEIEAIKLDSKAVATLKEGAERMLRFYDETLRWLTSHDHNHLRITRIIHCLRLLVSPEDALRFYKAILARHETAGAPVNARSLHYWAEAAGE